MTYKTFLRKILQGSREDFALVVAIVAGVFTTIMGICVFIAIGEHRLSAVVNGLAYLGSMAVGVVVIFFVTTFIYWFIARRK